MQFHDFHSELIYSSFGFLTIDACFFNNVNCSLFKNDFVIKLEQNVSCIFNKSQFHNLDNFEKVIHIFFNNKSKYKYCR